MSNNFDAIVESRITLIRRVLSAKGSEYATPSDRFHNFRLAALMGRTSAPRALWGMAAKHLVSVVDLVEGRLDHSDRDLVKEKVGDLINYLILLEGLFEEMGGESSP